MLDLIVGFNFFWFIMAASVLAALIGTAITSLVRSRKRKWAKNKAREMIKTKEADEEYHLVCDKLLNLQKTDAEAEHLYNEMKKLRPVDSERLGDS